MLNLCYNDKKTILVHKLCSVYLSTAYKTCLRTPTLYNTTVLHGTAIIRSSSQFKFGQYMYQICSSLHIIFPHPAEPFLYKRKRFPSGIRSCFTISITYYIENKLDESDKV